jgi:hypothetical protein
MKALATFYVSVSRNDPQKVALEKRTCTSVLEGTFSEKSGVRRGQKSYSSWSVGGRHFDHRFCGIGVRGISIAFAHKWLKSSLERLSKKWF